MTMISVCHLDREDNADQYSYITVTIIVILSLSSTYLWYSLLKCTANYDYRHVAIASNPHAYFNIPVASSIANKQRIYSY